MVIVQDHPPGFLALEQGRIVAYVADGILLAGLAAKARNPKDYEVVGEPFSKDPYSCMVPENDSKWRDFVNHTFMELIDSGKYFELYDKCFGEGGVVPYLVGPGPQLHDHAVHAEGGARLTAGARRSTPR